MIASLDANWRALVLAAVALLALGVGVRCYGNARAKDALALERAHTADSVSAVDEARFAASALASTAALTRAEHVADSAKRAAQTAEIQAQAAEQDAARARAEVQHLTAAQLAATPDSVRHALTDVMAANIELTSANTDLRLSVVRLTASVDSLTRGDSLILVSLAEARTALAAKDTAIAAYRRAKTPTHSALWRIGRTALQVGALAGAALIGHGLK